jgi:hypothetical protein
MIRAKRTQCVLQHYGRHMNSSSTVVSLIVPRLAGYQCSPVSQQVPGRDPLFFPLFFTEFLFHTQKWQQYSDTSSRVVRMDVLPQWQKHSS